MCFGVLGIGFGFVVGVDYCIELVDVGEDVVYVVMVGDLYFYVGFD